MIPYDKLFYSRMDNGITVTIKLRHNDNLSHFKNRRILTLIHYVHIHLCSVLQFFPKTRWGESKYGLQGYKFIQKLKMPSNKGTTDHDNSTMISGFNYVSKWHFTVNGCVIFRGPLAFLVAGAQMIDCHRQHA